MRVSSQTTSTPRSACLWGKNACDGMGGRQKCPLVLDKYWRRSWYCQDGHRGEVSFMNYCQLACGHHGSWHLWRGTKGSITEKFKCASLRLAEDSHTARCRTALASEQSLVLGVLSRNNLDLGRVGRGLFSSCQQPCSQVSCEVQM